MGTYLDNKEYHGSDRTYSLLELGGGNVYISFDELDRVREFFVKNGEMPASIDAFQQIGNSDLHPRDLKRVRVEPIADGGLLAQLGDAIEQRASGRMHALSIKENDSMPDVMPDVSDVL